VTWANFDHTQKQNPQLINQAFGTINYAVDICPFVKFGKNCCLQQGLLKGHVKYMQRAIKM